MDLLLRQEGDRSGRRKGKLQAYVSHLMTPWGNENSSLLLEYKVPVKDSDRPDLGHMLSLDQSLIPGGMGCYNWFSLGLYLSLRRWVG